MLSYLFKLYRYHPVLLVHTPSFPSRLSSVLSPAWVCSLEARCERRPGRLPGRRRLPHSCLFAVGDAVDRADEVVGNQDRAVAQFLHGDRPPEVFAVLVDPALGEDLRLRSEEHTSELPSLMRTSYAVFCLKKK